MKFLFIVKKMLEDALLISGLCFLFGIALFGFSEYFFFGSFYLDLLIFGDISIVSFASGIAASLAMWIVGKGHAGGL